MSTLKKMNKRTDLNQVANTILTKCPSSLHTGSPPHLVWMPVMCYNTKKPPLYRVTYTRSVGYMIYNNKSCLGFGHLWILREVKTQNEPVLLINTETGWIKKQLKGYLFKIEKKITRKEVIL